MFLGFLLTACGAGEPTAVSTSPVDDTGPVVISPRSVTVEARQPTLFRAFESDLPNSNGLASIEWTATGGMIGPDGAYASDATGTFEVIGKRRGSLHNIPDTARVIVVPPQPAILQVVGAPESSTVLGGQRQQSIANGLLSDGSTVAVGVTWTATGGSIDPGGLFTAGNVNGNYSVIARHPTTGLADTISVSVNAVRQLAINPADASVEGGANLQYEVSGVLEDGSVAPLATVAYTATGGTISRKGLYTAPARAGAYQVTATLVPASGVGLSADAGVTVIASAGVSATAWGGPGAFPHEPPGYTKFAEHDFSSLPNNSGRALAGRWTAFGMKPALARDGTAPVSAESVFEFTYPAELPVGSGVAAFQAWAYNGDTPIEYAEVYETGMFKIPTPDFETPGPGMKLLGYWGVGQCGVKVPAQIYTVINGNGSSTSLMSSWTLDFRQQNNVSRSMRANRSAKRVRAGVWHRYEVQMVLNDVDVPNGILRVWLDNGDGDRLQLTHEYIDVMYRTSARMSKDGIDSQCGFYGRRWDPIYGGRGGAAKSRTDRVWVDHVYISGIPK